MITPALLHAKFDRASPYELYLRSARPHQRAAWDASDARASLLPRQHELLATFTRVMPVLVISGTWCGDCVQQCPMLARIAEANPSKIHLRFLDRDAHLDLADQVMVCGGHRVPLVIFANEDFEFVHLFGDRTLTRYRAQAAKALGAACPLPGAPLDADDAAGTLQDWVNEFERVQLLLRLSPKLRERYGD
ncbi:MAG: thioredoxin family protein [Phycisphaerae bacterium]|nr:thioredoxin family protein [Phycisphaerae bacterium]